MVLGAAMPTFFFALGADAAEQNNTNERTSKPIISILVSIAPSISSPLSFPKGVKGMMREAGHETNTQAGLISDGSDCGLQIRRGLATQRFDSS